MFGLMVAAKLFLTTPLSNVGINRAKLEARFGRPVGIGTDYVPSPTTAGAKDNIVTLDWQELRVRLYLSSATNVVSLLGVTTIASSASTGPTPWRGVRSPVESFARRE